ncbi:MAG: hypothetical protein HY060_01425 [Proteobacteria bacterium]|nr:hypothetical protein [Pseudomonadota bacterium]
MLGAPRADAIDLDSLAGLQPDQIGAVQLVLDPALRFLASTWPVDAIWMANQPDRDGALALDDRPGFVQVRRLLDGVAGPRVEVTTLEEARFTFRRALALGLRLGDATASALAVDPLFDLALGLSQLFADRLVVRLWAPSPEPRPAD